METRSRYEPPARSPDDEFEERQWAVKPPLTPDLPPQIVQPLPAPPPPPTNQPLVSILDLLTGTGVYCSYYFELSEQELERIRKMVVNAAVRTLHTVVHKEGPNDPEMDAGLPEQGG